MPMHRLPIRLLFLFLTLLTGCGVGPLATSTATPGAALHGVVHGGQQPVAGAHVYLFAANTTGYAGPGLAASSSNASISLLTSSTGLSDSTGNYVLSGSGGGFNITGDYTCTSGQQLYLYANGGNSGAGTNSKIGLMAVLGSCPSVAYTSATAPSVFMDEVTTVAAAYAFAGFATDSTHVSTNGSTLATTGIANAFANAANLANLATGTAATIIASGNGVAPTQTINTLANILAACVNTADQVVPGPLPITAPSSTCVALQDANFSNGSTGNEPEDTATAAIYMAHNPAHNVATLYNLPGPTAPFGDALDVQPNDFTLTLAFTGGGLTAGTLTKPDLVAIDAAGNAWAANSFGKIAAFSPLGTPLLPPPASPTPASAP